MGVEENVITDKSKGVSIKNVSEIVILQLVNSWKSVEIDGTYPHWFILFHEKRKLKIKGHKNVHKLNVLAIVINK